jgi:hypothetical protein
VDYGTREVVMSALDELTSSSTDRATRVTKALLACGVLYGLMYVIANDVVAAVIFGDYDRVDQAVSELSAEGAVSRPFLVAMAAIWAPAMVAFGIGVRRSARGSRCLRVTGGLLVAFGVTSLAWLPLPMTAREDMVIGADAVANDVGHIAMSAVTIVLILAQIGFAAAALGRRFRLYSLATATIVLLFGALTGTQGPKLATGEATPWMGFYERVSIGAWMLWMAVLVVVLWQRVNVDEPAQPAVRPGLGEQSGGRPG